jgi:hypothetical protein
MTGSEQVAIVIFFLGFFLNLGLTAGSLKRVGVLLFIFLLSYGLVWFYREPDTTDFDVFGAAMVFFFIATVFVLYDRLLPELHCSSLLVYSILFFYVVWNLLDGEQAPLWFWIFPGIPALLALVYFLLPVKSVPSFLKQIFYFWFLVTGVTFMAAQFQLDQLKVIYDSQGWSWMVYLHVFSVGMVSVSLLAYVVFLIIHLPFGPRRSRLEEMITGDSEDLAENIRGYMRQQFHVDRPGLFNVGVIMLFAGCALVNSLYPYWSHVLFLNVSLVLLVPIWRYLIATSQLDTDEPQAGTKTHEFGSAEDRQRLEEAGRAG